MFFCMQKMNSIPNFCFRHCKDTANLLFWVLWECLIMPISNDSSTLQETLILKHWNQLVGNFDVCLHAKNQLYHWHYKLVFLGILGMLDHPHQNHSISLTGLKISVRHWMLCSMKFNTSGLIWSSNGWPVWDKILVSF